MGRIETRGCVSASRFGYHRSNNSPLIKALMKSLGASERERERERVEGESDRFPERVPVFRGGKVGGRSPTEN